MGVRCLLKEDRLLQWQSVLNERVGHDVDDLLFPSIESSSSSLMHTSEHKDDVLMRPMARRPLACKGA